MTSPDGKIQIIRHHLGNPVKRDFEGSIEIPGWSFQVSKRSFYDPMVFSDNSRFLAAAEVVADTSSYDPYSRVIVFDFGKEKEWIVHIEKAGSIETLRWTIDSLQIGAYSTGRGHEEHVWRPRDLISEGVDRKKFAARKSEE